MMEPADPRLEVLLRAVANGEQSVEQAVATLTGQRRPTSQAIDGVTLDLDRDRRCGFPEVIYGEGKSAEMIAGIMLEQRDAGQSSFATRVDASTAERVHQRVPDSRFNAIARTLSRIDQDSEPLPIPDQHAADRSHVAVVTAGSTDRPVAAEAIETLHWMNIPFRQVDDIGVAGPQRLLNAVPLLRHAVAVVVIAGMEGALPAALGGHLRAPIFAVPTSVGYGASLGGMTALFGMLSSCASNVAVVNIDAGFKAAYLSGLVLSQVNNRGRDVEF
ncbi:MAG: nickel pincer cofactor biosynthesis protein LarB [Planctomycetota bacterium]